MANWQATAELKNYNLIKNPSRPFQLLVEYLGSDSDRF